MAARILLEGRPGAGKTTVAARLRSLLDARGVAVAGFVTEEVREHGRRVGFTVRAFGGDEATLAHVALPGPPRVGRYGVDLVAFERVALPALGAQPRPGLVVVVDELGKMELASDAFCDAVLGLFRTPVDVVATTHVFRHPLTDSLKARSDVERVQVTRASRDHLPEQLADRLTGAGRP
jgi:nucleoside-triphosphatase